MPLFEDVLQPILEVKGPMPVADYMELALQHPEFGYYRRKNPLGKTGDFITAPEISQMFGEMIGLWCADIWRQMGKPEHMTLLELGPGQGTLMHDALRATAKIKGFHAALQVHLLESNQALRNMQQAKLVEHLPMHLDDLGNLPAQPMLVIANEFFDALPIRQFEKTTEGWCERLVGLQNGRLALTLSQPGQGFHMLLPEAVRESAVGTVHEVSLAALAMVRQLTKLIDACQGAALIIDYGASEPSGLSSLQAVSGHKATDIFDRPGEVDVTAHVDFGAIRMVASSQRVHIFGPVGQGEFLQAMGIELRAAQLKQQASEQQKSIIDAALDRLVNPSQMGTLFKAMAITKGDFQPAGFP